MPFSMAPLLAFCYVHGMTVLPDHLQKRLVWLEKTAASTGARLDKTVQLSMAAVERIDEHIALLEKRLETADRLIAAAIRRIDSLQKSLSAASGEDGNTPNRLHQHVLGIDEDVKALKERVQHLEFKAFPGMVDDTIRMFEIIGTKPTPRVNPLDKKSGSTT